MGESWALHGQKYRTILVNPGGYWWGVWMGLTTQVPDYQQLETPV
jgi:hypothetical protein